MEEQQISQQQTQLPVSIPSEHDHKGLYTTIALSLGAAAVLLVIVLSVLVKKPVIPQQQTQTYQVTQQDLQQPSSIQNQVEQVTPTPVQNKQGLEALAQQLDASTMTQVTTSLDQNSQQTSSFSQ